MNQVLCICYNSASSIEQTLISWFPYVDRFCILLNGGLNNDYSQYEETEKRIRALNKECLILHSDFDGFSNTRNKLIKASEDSRFKWSIFIDDSYRLIKWKPIKSDNIVQQLTVCHGTNSYPSNRIFQVFQDVKYTGKIHETIDTNLRYNSGISVRDYDYESHIKRRNDRQLYHLIQLKDDNTPRGLYYTACSVINLYKQGLSSKEEVLISIRARIIKPGDQEENRLIKLFEDYFLNGNK